MEKKKKVPRENVFIPIAKLTHARARTREESQKESARRKRRDNRRNRHRESD